jgi:hypothetical protein
VKSLLVYLGEILGKGGFFWEKLFFPGFRGGFLFQVVVLWEFHGDCNGDYNEDDICLVVEPDPSEK